MSPRSADLTLASALSLALLGAACGGDGAVPADVIDRETFIATYVDLRWAAAETSELRITSDQRDQILADRGLDGESLVRFADAHGRDLEFMNEVWAEVDNRLTARQAEGDPEPQADPTP